MSMKFEAEGKPEAYTGIEARWGPSSVCLCWRDLVQEGSVAFRNEKMAGRGS